MATHTLFATAGPCEPMLEHEIRIRAYGLYERRGAKEGHALDDWLKPSMRYYRRGVPLVLPSRTNVLLTDDCESLLRSIRSSKPGGCARSYVCASGQSALLRLWRIVMFGSY